MMIKSFLVVQLTLFVVLIHATISRADELVIYEPPPHYDASPEYELEVNGQRVFVYTSRVAAFAYFSFNGKVDLKVTYNGPIYNFDIRPKSRNISSSNYRNQVHFSLEEPANLSLEINKNIKRPLFIFANPMEENIPDRNDPDVIFFEGGKIHNPGTVMIESDQTVYIEGGAIVRGTFMTDKGKNIKIMGRGVIDNSRYQRREVRPIEINQCEDVLLEGIIINESRHWTCASFASRNVEYQNIKIVSDNDNDDGINVVGSQNVVIDNCFIRTKDDCIAVKAGITYYTDFFSGANVDNVVVKNSVLWNGVWGNGIEIGFETRADTIKNITFRNLDLIHVEGPEGTFTIHNGDRAVVKNVLYEDIRVEDSRGWLIDFKILESRYTKDQRRGFIENVCFKDITVEGDHFPHSQMLGYNEEHKIKDVEIEDFVIHGKKINSTHQGMITTIHTEGINFK